MEWKIWFDWKCLVSSGPVLQVSHKWQRSLTFTEWDLSTESQFTNFLRTKSHYLSHLEHNFDRLSLRFQREYCVCRLEVLWERERESLHFGEGLPEKVKNDVWWSDELIGCCIVYLLLYRPPLIINWQLSHYSIRQQTSHIMRFKVTLLELINTFVLRKTMDAYQIQITLWDWWRCITGRFCVKCKYYRLSVRQRVVVVGQICQGGITITFSHHESTKNCIGLKAINMCSLMPWLALMQPGKARLIHHTIIGIHDKQAFLSVYNIR